MNKQPMEQKVYELMDERYDTDWRSTARREFIYMLWQRYAEAKEQPRILDIGCGTGVLLAYLEERSSGRGTGIDLFSSTLPYCWTRGLNSLCVADAEELPFKENSFDFIAAVDLLEHLPNDQKAIADAYRICAEYGLFLVIAPAFDFLWSTRDVRLQHKRRYTVEGLGLKFQAAGFDIVKQTYIDLFLFPVLWLAVRIGQPFGPVADIRTDIPNIPGFLNSILLNILRAEALYLLRGSAPFGVATLVVGRKPGDLCRKK